MFKSVAEVNAKPIGMIQDAVVFKFMILYAVLMDPLTAMNVKPIAGMPELFKFMLFNVPTSGSKDGQSVLSTYY